MYSRCAKIIVIWVKPNGIIYHKFVSGHYSDYYIGYINNYGHEILYIIDNLQFRVDKPPFKQRFKRQLINYISKM